MRHGSGPILSKPLTGLSGGCIQPGVRYPSVRKTACDPVLGHWLESGCGRHPPRVVIVVQTVACTVLGVDTCTYLPVERRNAPPLRLHRLQATVCTTITTRGGCRTPGWHHDHDSRRGWHTNRVSWRAILVSHLAILCRDPKQFARTWVSVF